MKYSYNMRLRLVACVLLAVVGMATAQITSLTEAIITATNPLTIKVGALGITAPCASTGDGAVTITGDASGDPCELTVDITTIEKITAHTTGSKIILETLAPTTTPFIITTQKDAIVEGGLTIADTLELTVAGGNVTLTGTFKTLTLVVSDVVRRNQATPDSTVHISEITGPSTVANTNANADIRLTLGTGGAVSGTTASSVCTPGGTTGCTVTAVPPFTGPPCIDCLALASPPSPESPESPPPPPSPGSPSSPPAPSPSTPSSPSGPPGPSGPPSPGASPSVSPLGCKHYRFWVQHTHGVDCEKEKDTKSEYIKWLCHNAYCN